MIPCLRFAALSSIPAFAVGCANQDGPHRGVETGAGDAAVDAVFSSSDQPNLADPLGLRARKPDREARAAATPARDRL